MLRRVELILDVFEGEGDGRAFQVLSLEREVYERSMRQYKTMERIHRKVFEERGERVATVTL